jgi:protein-L-isoaspartate O-methyltransferase
MADTAAIQTEIAGIEKKIEELQAQLADAKSRLQKSQAESYSNDAAAKLSDEEKMALITVNLKEVLNPEIMEAALKKGGPLKVYWGTATTGRPHCGYVGCQTPGNARFQADYCCSSSRFSRLRSSSLQDATSRFCLPISTASLIT